MYDHFFLNALIVLKHLVKITKFQKVTQNHS